jgi:prepilin-type N-terminal cleavage/methylation domain-containing protein
MMLAQLTTARPFTIFQAEQSKGVAAMKSPSRGFTLTELLVAVAVIGILITVGGVSFIRELPHYRLRGDAGTIHRSFMTARTQATSSGRQFAIRFNLDADPQEYVLQEGNAFSGSTVWTTRAYRKELSPAVSIDRVVDDGGSKTSGTARVIFNPNGSCGTGDIFLGSAAHGYRVFLTPTPGRVQTHKGWS